MQLNKRPRGSSGLEITTVGFGAWAIGGGGWSFRWGPQDDQASERTMQRAIELGINSTHPTSKPMLLCVMRCARSRGGLKHPFKRLPSPGY